MIGGETPPIQAGVNGGCPYHFGPRNSRIESTCAFQEA
jgi:hypothetical protein